MEKIIEEDEVLYHPYTTPAKIKMSRRFGKIVNRLKDLPHGEYRGKYGKLTVGVDAHGKWEVKRSSGTSFNYLLNSKSYGGYWFGYGSEEACYRLLLDAEELVA